MTAFQGFDKKLNLSENVDDIAVLNNLGGNPIAFDINLFQNNLRNVSTLTVEPDNIQAPFIVFDPNLQRFVFTNGTKITVDGTEYYVGNSNGVNQFQIFNDQSLSDLVTEPPSGGYVRSDAVLRDDIINLVRFRDIVVENPSLSQIGNVADSEIENIYSSFIRSYDQIRTGFRSNLNSYINSIETELDLFGLRKENSLNTLNDFTSDSDLRLLGNIIVRDPDGVNDNSIDDTQPNRPGIFILNPDTNQSTRIFSSSENVWSEEPDDLIVASQEIFVGNLVFNDGVRLVNKNDFIVVQTPEQNELEFTHYVTITVDGEEYSLCLK